MSKRECKELVVKNDSQWVNIKCRNATTKWVESGSRIKNGKSHKKILLQKMSAGLKWGEGRLGYLKGKREWKQRAPSENSQATSQNKTQARWVKVGSIPRRLH